MIEVIPSINAPTFDEVQERIAKVEPYVSWCHLDVTDGVFSAHPTWRTPADIARLKTLLAVEVHLMIADPDGVITQWFVPQVRRIIVHMEAITSPEVIIRQCYEAGKEIGLAINPDTPWTAFEAWFGRVDLFLPLGVPPGASGQKSDWDLILGKIASIRNVCPSCIIEADGGINQKTAAVAVAAGADILVAGSAIFDAPDIATAIHDLQHIS